METVNSALPSERIQAIKERCEKATLGPWTWRYEAGMGSWSLISPTGEEIVDDGSAAGEYGKVIDPNGADAALLAHSRQDIPDLLAEVSRLAGEVERLRKQLGDK